ncbi:MAG: hypothetical protein HOV94_26865 [Saccharothrix sp.]|nr:hypothetical protein [Saccharothrix sp.]
MQRCQHLFRSRRARDAMAALVVAGPAAVGLLTGLYRLAPTPTATAFTVISALCAVVVALWRREHDWMATVVACATFLLTDLPYPIYVMTFSVTRRRRWLPAVVNMAFVLVWPAHQALFEPISTGRLFEFEQNLPAAGLNGLVYWSLAAVAPFVMGVAKNSLEEASAERERHAALAAERQQRLRESTLRERALTERARLATMVHDGVGHHVSVMVTTAGAISVDAAATESIRRRCDLIARVGREAMGRLGEVLDLLATPDVRAEVPGFGLDDIAHLVGDYRSLGVEVTCAVVEPPGTCDPATADLCYRVVREALSNVLRHAGTQRAHVELVPADDHVRLTVSSPFDPEDRPSLPGTGRGLRLLTEEAELAGGVLTAAPSTDATRFELCADLPLSPHVERSAS